MEQQIMETEVLTTQERITFLGDQLISSIIKNTPESIQNRKYLFSQFDTTMFKNENFLIYFALYRFKDKRFTLDKDFLEIYYVNNSSLLELHKAHIDISAYADSEFDEKKSYIGATVKQFVRLSQTPVLSLEELEMTIEKYRIMVLAEEASKLYGTADLIVMDSHKVGSKTYAGFEDSKAYIKKEFARLENISGQEKGEGFIAMRGRKEEEDDKVKPIRVTSWGIKELDVSFNGIYTADFISILAPPKAGKTKLCVQLAHNSMLSGSSVVVWAVEGGRHAWESQIRAKHFDYVYNKDIVDIRQKKVGVSTEAIKKNAFASEEIRHLEKASRGDLFDNPNYGELHFVDRPFEVETFIDDLNTVIQLSGAKVVIVDYLQLISSNSGMKKNEAIGEAYKTALKWCKAKNVTFISPAQYNQEFIKETVKKGDSSTAEVRTAGGESSEIIRTPDINIALWASADDLLNGETKFLSVPSRNASPFPEFMAKCDLSCCNFYSMD